MSDDMSSLLVLGQGSNILFTDDFHGVVVRNEIGGINVTYEDETSVMIEAGSGVIWNDLVEFTVSREWWGIEKPGPHSRDSRCVPGTELRSLWR
jgi:UDP-N-acetylmuramate dehydrogenase